MQNTQAGSLTLPAGYSLIKTGGRPKKEARDAAVFLAKFWRTEAHDEQAGVAEQWIVDTWETIGKKASKGISETAHVRAAIKRCRDRGLNSSLLIIDHETGICTAVECEKTPLGFSLIDGARSWHWVNGLAEAVGGEVKNPKVSMHQKIMRRSPIATAATSYLNDLS